MSIDKLNLTHFHALQSITVAFGSDARRGGAVHDNGSLINLSLDKHSVRDNADIRTQTENLHTLEVFRFRYPFRQLIGAEGRLIDYLTAPGIECGRNLPAVSSLYAVGNGKLFSLRCVKIVLTVSISGKNNSVTVFTLKGDFILNLVYYSHGLLRAESAVDKVILHIDNT